MFIRVHPWLKAFPHRVARPPSPNNPSCPRSPEPKRNPPPSAQPARPSSAPASRPRFRTPSPPAGSSFSSASSSSPALILTQTFFTAFARATVHEAFWATEEFWFFGLGLVLWLVTFVALPRPTLVYVFGHELTHALWVWCMGGRVSAFQVTERGGHILSDRINTWIALAPYFFPIYSLLVIAIYGALGLAFDLTPFRPVLFMLIGATWGFHLSFTLWMIPKGQSDLHYGGTFFSLTIIYTLNLAILAVFLVVASPNLTLADFGRDLLANAVTAAVAATDLVQNR